MNRIFLFATALFLMTATVSTFAQDDRVYPVTGEMPSLPGCEDAGEPESLERRRCAREKLDEIVEKYLKYPSDALEADTGGVAIIGFIVRSDGKVTDMEILEDPGYGMGDAAMAAVKKANKLWIPGKDKGTPVSVQMRVPVHFDLPDDEGTDAAPAAGGLPDVLTYAEQMPRYAGCADKTGKEGDRCTRDSLVQILRTSLKYPEAAKSAGTEGQVVTSFVVDEQGSMTNVEVVEGLGNGCDEEALRVIKGLGKWLPGQQDGKPVKVRMEIPVRFRLPTSNSNE